MSSSLKIKTIIIFSRSFNSRSEKLLFWRDFNYKEKPYIEFCLAGNTTPSSVLIIIILWSESSTNCWLITANNVAHDEQLTEFPPHPISHQAQSFSFICSQHIMKSWWKLEPYAKDKGHCPQTKSLIRSCCEFQSWKSGGDTDRTFLVGLFRLHLNCKLQIVTQQHRFDLNICPQQLLVNHKHTSYVSLILEL